MKVFQYKHQKIFIREQLNNDERFAEQYRNLCEAELRLQTICKNKIYECINLQNRRVSSRPLIIECLLRKKEQPPFKFLVGKN